MLRTVLSALASAALLAGAPAGAQDPKSPPDADDDRGFGPGPDLRTIDPRVLKIPDFDLPLDLEGGPEEAAAQEQPEEPPLTREERMDKLFAELAAAEDDAEAAFIAEEIEALWRDSGSPTVDLLTDRATDALDMGEPNLARELS